MASVVSAASAASAVAGCPSGPAAVCLAPPAQPASVVHRDTSAILAEPQFRHGSPSWLASLDNSVGHFLDRLFGALFSSDGLTVAGLVVAGLILLLAVYLATRFATRVTRDPGIDVRPSGPAVRRPVEWKAEAAVHEAAGEWRDAVRCHYRALVAELAERGVVEEIPGRTVREYEREVGARLPPSADLFVAASDIFELVWYGYEQSGPEQNERLKDLASGVLARSR